MLQNESDQIFIMYHTFSDDAQISTAMDILLRFSIRGGLDGVTHKYIYCQYVYHKLLLKCRKQLIYDSRQVSQMVLATNGITYGP